MVAVAQGGSAVVNDLRMDIDPYWMNFPLCEPGLTDTRPRRLRCRIHRAADCCSGPESVRLTLRRGVGARKLHRKTIRPLLAALRKSFVRWIKSVEVVRQFLHAARCDRGGISLQTVSCK
jgi:hypothetical protein